MTYSVRNTRNVHIDSCHNHQAVRPVVRPTQCAPAPCKWWLEQPPRAFSLEVTAHVGDAGHRTPFLYQYTVYPYTFPFRRYGWFSVTALSGLVTFVNSTVFLEWGHGSPVSQASFLPIFSFLYALPFSTKVRHGTDQTDGRQPSMLIADQSTWAIAHE